MLLEQLPFSTRQALKGIPVYEYVCSTNVAIRVRLTTVDLQWLEHGWLFYHGCFEFVLESLRKYPFAADLGHFRVIVLFILKMVYCMYSLESSR